MENRRASKRLELKRKADNEELEAKKKRKLSKDKISEDRNPEDKISQDQLSDVQVSEDQLPESKTHEDKFPGDKVPDDLLSEEDDDSKDPFNFDVIKKADATKKKTPSVSKSSNIKGPSFGDLMFFINNDPDMPMSSGSTIDSKQKQLVPELLTKTTLTISSTPKARPKKTPTPKARKTPTSRIKKTPTSKVEKASPSQETWTPKSRKVKSAVDKEYMTRNSMARRNGSTPANDETVKSTGVSPSSSIVSTN